MRFRSDDNNDNGDEYLHYVLKGSIIAMIRAYLTHFSNCIYLQ